MGFRRQIEADEGLRPDLPTADERGEIKELREEVFELRRASEILKSRHAGCCSITRRSSGDASALQ